MLKGYSLGFRKPSREKDLKCYVQGWSASLRFLPGHKPKGTIWDGDILFYASDIAQLGQPCSHPQSCEFISILQSAGYLMISTGLSHLDVMDPHLSALPTLSFEE